MRKEESTMEFVKFEYREPEKVALEDVDSVLSDFEKDVEQACIKLFAKSFPRKLGEDVRINALDIWEYLCDGFPSSAMVADIEKAMKHMGNIMVCHEVGTVEDDNYYCRTGWLIPLGIHTRTLEDKILTIEWSLDPPFRLPVSQLNSGFKENLRKCREALGINAKDFAAQIGVKYTTYANYENVGSEPNYETLVKIATALHVSIDKLLGYKVMKHNHEGK
jgi:DNA-binding XRE family transcriptional regulator